MSNEKAPRSPERTLHVPSAEVKGHKERLNEQIETNAEKVKNSSEQVDEARHEIHEHAVLASEMAPPSNELKPHTTPQPITRAEKSKSFKTTMHHVRKNLSTPERAMSKVIHQPTIERASEIAGKTIARPSGLIGAATAGLIGLAFIFSIAKYAGFQLSGSEMPLLLLAGLVVGLLSEWVYKALRSLVS